MCHLLILKGHNDDIESFYATCVGRKICNTCSYAMPCPPVRGDNSRALTSGLSYVQVDNHGITILYYEGGSICNENPFITPYTNALGFNAIRQTKDQSVAVIMVHETLSYFSKFNKLLTF